MIEITTWEEIRYSVRELNEKLFNAIEAINPSNQYKLYKIRYPFGATILNNGVFHLPNHNGEIVPIEHISINKHIRQDLLYNSNSNPVGIAIEKSAEIYLEANNDIVIPFVKLTPGKILGTWGILDSYCTQPSLHPATIWNMSAGARSIFMIPKIGNKTFHQNIQRDYKITQPAPKLLKEHWPVFKELINKTNNVTWNFEILFFSKKWFTHSNDPSWQPLHNYFLESAWCNSNYLRNQSFLNLVFSLIRKEQELPPNSYINDIVKNLFGVACSTTLGFSPAITDNDAPISVIQDIYMNGSYKLKNYLPIIMTPSLLSETAPVYFSLNNITSLEFSEYQNKRNNLFQSIKKVQEVMNEFIKGMASSHLNLTCSEFFKNISSVKFEYYNDHVTHSSKIKDVKRIFKDDQNFKKILIPTKNKALPTNGNFIQACIKISKIKTK